MSWGYGAESRSQKTRNFLSIYYCNLHYLTTPNFSKLTQLKAHQKHTLP